MTPLPSEDQVNIIRQGGEAGLALLFAGTEPERDAVVYYALVESPAQAQTLLLKLTKWLADQQWTPEGLTSRVADTIAAINEMA